MRLLPSGLSHGCWHSRRPGSQRRRPYLGLAIGQEEIGSTFVLGGPGAVDKELAAHPLLPLLPSSAEALQGAGRQGNERSLPTAELCTLPSFTSVPPPGPVLACSRPECPEKQARRCWFSRQKSSGAVGKTCTGTASCLRTGRSRPCRYRRTEDFSTAWPSKDFCSCSTRSPSAGRRASTETCGWQGDVTEGFHGGQPTCCKSPAFGVSVVVDVRGSLGFCVPWELPLWCRNTRSVACQCVRAGGWHTRAVQGEDRGGSGWRGTHTW